MTEMDMIYPTMVFDLLPPGLLGIVLAGLIAAMMSSLDSGLNSVSTLVTMDFVQKIKPNMDSKGLMITGRVITLVVMIIAILWAPQIGNFEKLWDYLQNTLAWFCPPIVALFVMGLFSKKANNMGAIASIIVGFSITVFLIGSKIADVQLNLPNFLYVATIHFLICCAVLYSFSFFGERKTEEELAKVVWTREEYNNETVSLRDLPWYKNYRYQGIALLIVVILILLVY